MSVWDFERGENMKKYESFWHAIRRKLISRKFWISIAGFVSGLIILNGGGEDKADKISGAILAGASVVGYAIGEGLSDGEEQ